MSRPDAVPTDGPAAAAPSATVTTYPDGPLVLRGDFEIRDVDGDEIESGRIVALCRCGRSATKPFCDGTHKLSGRAPRPVG